MKNALLLLAILLTGCAYSAVPPAPKPLPQPPVAATASFQFGQNVTIELNETGNKALQQAFTQWVGQGVYMQSPVYRQLPGSFILTGKPRLAGQGFVTGSQPSPMPKQKKLPEARPGEAGLVVHTDGTVGPELILVYGRVPGACCDAPQNIRIGKITSGLKTLKSVQRGDNLQSLTLNPRTQ